MHKNRLQQLRRYRTIVGTLARNGFGYAAEEFGEKGRTLFHKQDADQLPKENKLGQRIRHMLEQLGPTFVKLGQIASTRPDLIPADLVEELQKLQDRVSPFPYSEAVQLVEGELGAPLGEMFASFSEEALAAASIGQVHRAVLKDGRQVIVKIQRPGIQATVETDLDILAEWARITESRLEWARHYRLRDAIDELSRALLKELNYVEEARHAEKMKAANRLPYVYIPDIYWELTTRRVLTMQYIDGIPLSDQVRLTEQGHDREQLARRLATAVFTQILTDGFFHADPHPGNVLAMPDGRLAFLDFGLVGRLPDHLKKHFAAFVIALRNQSTRGVIRAISDMGVIPDDVDHVRLQDDVDELRQKYYQVPLKQVSVGEAVRDLFAVASRHRIRIPNEITMLGKSMLTMEGVATALDPDMSVIDVAEPFGRKLFLERLNPLEIGKQLLEDIPDVVDLMREVPMSLKQLSAVIRQGKLRVEVDSSKLGDLLVKLDRISNRLSFSIVLLALSIVILGLIIGAAISGTSSPLISRVPIIELGFLIALLMFLWLIYAIFRSGRF